MYSTTCIALKYDKETTLLAYFGMMLIVLNDQ